MSWLFSDLFARPDDTRTATLPLPKVEAIRIARASGELADVAIEIARLSRRAGDPVLSQALMLEAKRLLTLGSAVSGAVATVVRPDVDTGTK